MSPILPKDQMTEEDIKLNYITPAIQSRGWKDRITMETAVYFTDGRRRRRAVLRAEFRVPYALFHEKAGLRQPPRDARIQGDRNPFDGCCRRLACRRSINYMSSRT